MWKTPPCSCSTNWGCCRVLPGAAKCASQSQARPPSSFKVWTLQNHPKMSVAICEFVIERQFSNSCPRQTWVRLQSSMHFFWVASPSSSRSSWHGWPPTAHACSCRRYLGGSAPGKSDLNDWTCLDVDRCDPPGVGHFE